MTNTTRNTITVMFDYLVWTPTEDGGWEPDSVERQTFLDILKKQGRSRLQVLHVYGGDRQSDHYVGDRSYWDPQHFYMLRSLCPVEDLPF